ncbi:MAG: tRNA (adenosine(37)-N6)-threonylcarbamoyltransferase complex ATPase subunit type 1 TsaE [Lewinella sp.]|nr:tRNA (adenosine(37)-N6)-threonylcarbamoyltransferase complex ATPase subunit type 1 TsaE [Lewinella sp.]
MIEKSAALSLHIGALPELDAAVQSLLAYAQKRRIMAFCGEIGAGKTTFIQSFCQHLGVKEPVTSPTFSLVNEYGYDPVDGGTPSSVYHMDLYRLKDMEEALDFGIEEYLDSGAYCLIEWPELVESLLPEDTVWINIRIVDDSTRKMLIL